MAFTGSYLHQRREYPHRQYAQEVLDPKSQTTKNPCSQNTNKHSATQAFFSPLVHRVTDCFRSVHGAVSRIATWSTNTCTSMAPLLLGVNLLPSAYAETLSNEEPQDTLPSYSVLDSLSSLGDTSHWITYACAFIATTIAGIAATRFLFKRHTIIKADRIGMVNPHIHGDAHIHVEGNEDTHSRSPKEILALITTAIVGIAGALLYKQQAKIQANSIGMLNPEFHRDNPIHQTVSGTGAVGMLNPQFYGNTHIHMMEGAPVIPPKEVSAKLRLHYSSKQYMSLLIPQEPGSIPIEKLYTKLALIGEAEKTTLQAGIADEKPGSSLHPPGDTRVHTHEIIFEPKKPIDLEEIFNHSQLKHSPDSKYILIQGSAGIGKSTLCHHIAYRWAKGELFPQFDYLLWIPLRRLRPNVYDKGTTFEEYLSKECSIDVHSILNPKCNQKTLVILDGYDELSYEASHPNGCFYPILKKLESFAHVIVTSRPQVVDFKGHHKPLKLEILGFDSKGMDHYIHQFFSKEQAKQAAALRTYLRNPLARSLAHIPINLEIFCSLAVNDDLILDPNHPPTITSIYYQLSEWLFKRFRLYRSETKENKASIVESRRTTRAKDVKNKIQCLGKIAWDAMQSNTLYLDIDAIEDACERFEVQLADIRNIGPFRIEHGEGQFIHLTFQEYFAATHLARFYIEGKISEATEHLEDIKFEPRYTLTLWMTAGYLSQQKSLKPLQAFFDGLFAEPTDVAESYELRLFAQCFEECRYPERIRQHKHFIERVVHYIQEAPLKDMLLQLFNRNTKLLHHPDVVEALLESMENPKKHALFFPLMHACAQEKLLLPPRVIERLIENAQDTNFEKQQKYIIESIAMLAYTGSSAASDALVHLITTPQLGSYNHSTTQVSERPLSFDPIPQTNFHKNVRIEATHALGNVAVGARQGDIQALEALTYMTHNYPIIAALIEMNFNLKDYNYSDIILETLLAIVKVTDVPFPEAMDFSIKIAQHPGVDYRDRAVVINAIKEVAKSGNALSSKALKALTEIAQDDQLEGYERARAFDAIAEITQSEHGESSQALHALIYMAQNPQIDSDTQSRVASALGEVAQAGKIQAQQAFNTLILMAQNSQLESTVQSSIASALGNLGQIGETQAQQALNVLVPMVQNSPLDSNVQGNIAYALGKIGQGKHAHAQEARRMLIQMGRDPKLDTYTQNCVTYALRDIATSENVEVLEVMEVLTNIAKNPKLETSVRSTAIDTIGEISKARHFTSDEIINCLCHLLKAPKTEEYIKTSSARALESAIQAGSILPDETLDMLIQMVIEAPSYDDAALTTVKTFVEKGHAFPQKTLDILYKVAKDPQTKSYDRDRVISVLEGIAQGKHTLASDALDVLCTIVKDLQLEDEDQHRVVSALAEVAQAQHILPLEMIELFVRIGENSQNSNQDQAVEALRKVSPYHFAQMIVDTKSHHVVQRACYLTSKALAISKDAISVSDSRDKASTPLSDPL